MGMTYIYPPVTVSMLPPIGGATSANQLLEIAELTTLNAEILNIQTQINAIKDLLTKVIVETLYFDYSVTNVSNAGWTELIAATSDEINHMTLFESGGYPLEVGIGAIGAEVKLFLVPAGGFNGQIDISIPTGSRVSVRGIQTQVISEGFILANFSK